MPKPSRVLPGQLAHVYCQNLGTEEECQDELGELIDLCEQARNDRLKEGFAAINNGIKQLYKKYNARTAVKR